MTSLALLIALLVVPTAEVPQASLNVMVLIGHPDEAAGSSAAVTIAPGTVLYAGPGAWAFAGENSAARAERYVTLAERLKEDYRLASISPEPAKSLRLEVDQTEVVPTVDAGPTVEITPLAIEPHATTYRVRLKQGATLLAEPTVAVRRNGLAIVGTRDGKAAPYLFVVLEDTADLAKRLVREPKKIYNVSPHYPPEAKEARVQGIVMIKCRIDVEGRMAHAEVVRGIQGELGTKLNEAALEAVRQWRYEPAVDEGGSPTEIEMTITINFKLSPPDARPPK